MTNTEQSKDQFINEKAAQIESLLKTSATLIREIKNATQDQPRTTYVEPTFGENAALGDRARNPGSMNRGHYSRLYGMTSTIEGTPGNHTAVFPTFSHGVAALVGRITRDVGVSIHEFIEGGDTIAVRRSYSGGHNNGRYVQALVQNSDLTADSIISFNKDFLIKMVNGHAFAEGNKFRCSMACMERAWDLMKSNQHSNLYAYLNGVTDGAKPTVTLTQV